MWGAVQKQRLFFKSSNLLQRAYTVIKFRHANADGHVIIHDLADLRVAGGAHQAISVREVQIKLLHQEVDRILGADLDAFLQRAAGSKEVQAVRRFDDRALNGTVVVDRDAQAHTPRDLDARAGELAVAHAGVHIAHSKPGALGINRKIHARTDADQLGVHVGAVVLRHRAVDLAAFRGDTHHADHRRQGQLDIIGKMCEAIVHGNDLGVRLRDMITQHAESDRCDHHALRRKVDRHNFHAKGIAGVRTADRDRAYGAVHDADVNIRALDAFVGDLTAIAVVALDPEGLSVLDGIVCGICRVEVEDHFIFRDHTHDICPPFPLPTCRQDADHGADEVDGRKAEDHDDHALHCGMRVPTALPLRLDIALLAGVVEHQNGNDRHNHAAEGTGPANGVNKADKTGVGKDERGKHRAGDGDETGLGVLLILELEHIDDVREHGTADRPIRGHHGAEGKNVGGIERPGTECLTPGERSDLCDLLRAGQRENGKGNNGQQHAGDEHTENDGNRELLGRVAHTARQLRHGILRDVAENSAAEKGNGIGPVCVYGAGDIRLAGEEGCDHNDAEQHDHARGHEFLPKAGGFEAEPDDQHTGNGEQQAARPVGETEQCAEDVAGTCRVGDHAADGVRADRDEDQDRADLTDIFFRKAGQLQGLFCTQCGLRHIEHGERGEQTGHRQPEHQDRPSRKAGRICKAEYTGTDIGTHDDRYRLIKCELCYLERAFFDVQVFFFH